jgi:hypothetical protein
MVYMIYLVSDKSLVSLVFQLLRVWGISELTTIIPALYPIRSTSFMLFIEETLR